jgi:hypothetical protein
MPSINNYTNKHTSKKFKKTAYRPWTTIEDPDNSVSSSEDVTVDLRPAQAFEKEIEIEQKETIISLIPEETIRKQLVTDCESFTNCLENNNETTKEQLDVSLPNVSQSFNNQFSKHDLTILEVATDISASNNWSQQDAIYHLSRLCGLQKKLLLYIGTKCLARNDLCSGPISVRDLGDSIQLKLLLSVLYIKGL